MTKEISITEALKVGELLRIEREKQDISTKQLATALNLPERFILYLESGEFDKLPGNTFVRGYIRNYIKYLNLEDGQSIISLFEQQAIPELKEGKMLDFKQIKRLKSVSNSIYWLVSFVVCIVLAGILFLIWQHYVSSKASGPEIMTTNTVIESNQSLPPENTPLDTNTTQAIIPLTTLGTDTDTNTENTNNIIVPSEGQIATETNDSLQEPEPTTMVKKGEGRVQATFSGNCWISVKDATGKELVQGVFSAKKNLDITGKAPFDIMIGAPNTISLNYNGKPIKIEAKSSSSHRMKLGN